VNEACELYGQAGRQNLIVRKVYGADGLRYLRCRCCGREFSERKRTALWNTKVRETKAIAVAEHLAEGNSAKSIARLVKVDASVVRRLNGAVRQHGRAFHDARVHDVQVKALHGDERHGFTGDKGTPVWEAELLDPASKFVLSHVQGRRDETLIRRLLQDGAQRLHNRHDLVLFTDGEPSYATLFPALFGRPYHPVRRGERGRYPQVRYRIPRTLAHVQVVKHHAGRRLTHIEIRYAHGSQKRVRQALEQLGYRTPNTSAIERRNGTARRMSAYQARKSLAFARRPDTKLGLGWWGVTVYNWCRSNRALRQPIPDAQGKKSSFNAHLPWPLDSPIAFFPSLNSFSLRSTLDRSEIISHDYPSVSVSK
jgi:IS1 family transposase/transposase-like protein